MPSTTRFLRQFLLPRPESTAREEVTIRRGERDLPASLYRPVASHGRLPAWIALHGLTHRGREHESLVPLAQALATSGTAVLVPDIPEWRELRVAPDATAETILAAVTALEDRPQIADRIGVIGFSFGGTHALMATTEPALAGRVTAVASWGGYADLRRTLRFAFTGRHELDGDDQQLDPDPYGRWIFTGNYLTHVPEHEDAADVAGALLWLAQEVGRRKIMAWEPATDPLKAQARARLSDGRDRDLFDGIAPPTHESPTPTERERRAELAHRLAEAALSADAGLDPTELLPRVAVPVFLAHGRDDRLIPWTELVRLRRALPSDHVRHSVITGLFSHSFRERRFPTPGMAVEAFRFVRAINRMVHLI